MISPEDELKIDASLYDKCIKIAKNIDSDNEYYDDDDYATKFYIGAGKEPDHIIKLFNVRVGDGCFAMRNISPTDSSEAVYKIYKEGLIPICFIRIHHSTAGEMSYAGGYMLKNVPLLSITTKISYIRVNDRNSGNLLIIPKK